MGTNKRLTLAMTLVALGFYALPNAISYVKSLSYDNVEKMTTFFQQKDAKEKGSKIDSTNELIACGCVHAGPNG